MIAFLFEFSTLLALFGLGYLLLKSSTSSYKIQRWYIKASIFLSVVFPLIPEFASNEILIYSLVLPETLIQANGIGEIGEQLSVQKTISLEDFLFYLIISITLFFTVRFLYSLYVIARIISKAKVDQREEITLLRSSETETPFSFLKYVVLPDNICSDPETVATVIQHEKLHVRYNHSIEKIFIELFKVLVWWHPVSWMYSKEIELLHEFQVDEAMTSSMEFRNYKKILLQLIIDPQGPRMINPFSSNIKKRLLKMNQEKIKNSPLRFAFLFCILCFGSLFIHSCQQEDSETNVIEKVNTIDAKVTSQQDPYEITRVDTFTIFDYDSANETVKITESKDQVFIKPSKMPLFPGCDPSLSGDELQNCSNEKLLKYIYNNLTYPEVSRNNGVEGMVLVRFVVDKEGWVFNKEFLRSPDIHLQNAVDKMLTKMNADYTWIPGEHNGKKVNVQYTLPVKFKLEDNNDN